MQGLPPDDYDYYGCMAVACENGGRKPMPLRISECGGVSSRLSGRPGGASVLGAHNRPLRVGATHREATKPSEAECRGVSPATKEGFASSV